MIAKVDSWGEFQKWEDFMVQYAREHRYTIIVCEDKITIYSLKDNFHMMVYI